MSLPGTEDKKFDKTPVANTTSIPSVRARILIDYKAGETQFKCGDLIEADSKLIDYLVSIGVADKSKSAVDYCVNSGATIIKKK